eukprot:GHVR01100776.1.p1 GENE.GHVR01100776.1~~GHVR01100776.1.p1  ORF type:complete len:1276 (+),score=120.63 GHVR01100776.1:1258-5085(+)
MGSHPSYSEIGFRDHDSHGVEACVNNLFLSLYIYNSFVFYINLFCVIIFFESCSHAVAVLLLDAKNSSFAIEKNKKTVDYCKSSHTFSEGPVKKDLCTQGKHTYPYTKKKPHPVERSDAQARYADLRVAVATLPKSKERITMSYKAGAISEIAFSSCLAGGYPRMYCGIHTSLSQKEAGFGNNLMRRKKLEVFNATRAVFTASNLGNYYKMFKSIIPALEAPGSETYVVFNAGNGNLVRALHAAQYHILCAVEQTGAYYALCEKKLREVGIDAYKVSCKSFPHNQAFVTAKVLEKKLVYILFIWNIQHISYIFNCNKYGDIIIICTECMMLLIPEGEGHKRLYGYDYTFINGVGRQETVKLYMYRLPKASMSPWPRNVPESPVPKGLRLDEIMHSVYTRSTPVLNKRAGLYEMATDPKYVNPLHGVIKHMKFLGTGRRPTFLPEYVTVTDYKWLDTLAEHSPSLLYETQRWKFSQPTLRGLYDNLQKYDHRVLQEAEFDLGILEKVMARMQQDFKIEESELRVVRAATQANISKMKRGITVEGFDMRKNPGFPYCMTYKTKGDAEIAAVLEAKECYRRKTPVDHDWVCFGKPKEHMATGKKKCRLVICPAMSQEQATRAFLKAFTDYMNSKAETTPYGPGICWYHGGGERFASYFQKRPEDVIHGENVDFSDWDGRLPSVFLKRLFRWIADLLKLDTVQREFYLTMMYSTINPTVRMPDGNRYKLPQGMPSGVLVTALGNTLCHYIARSYAKYKRIEAISASRVKKILGRSLEREKLFDMEIGKYYGDDGTYIYRNRFIAALFGAASLAPEFDNVGMLLNYPKCSKARKFKELEYLSRFPVELCNGQVATVRKSWRSSVRMMNNKRSYESEDVQEAYNLGKAIAHYIDNFHNMEIRHLIEQYVEKLKVRFALYDISGKSARVQHIEATLGALPRTFPTHEEMQIIYGTNTITLQTLFYSMNRLWENGVNFDKVLPSNEKLYKKSCEIATLPLISEDATLAIRHRTCPFTRYLPYRGNAGMKVSEVVRMLNIPRELLLTDCVARPSVTDEGDACVAECSVIDVGSHPGSAINALRLAFPLALITGISKKHIADSNKDFCYKVSDRTRLQLLESSYESYLAYAAQLFVNIDLSEGDATTASQHLSLIKVALKTLCVSRPTYAAVKFRGIESQGVYKAIRYLYRHAEEFHFFKPKASYPWNDEMVVAVKMLRTGFKVVPVDFMNRYVGVVHKLYVLNKVSREILNYNSMKGRRLRNPLQEDASYQLGLFRKILQITKV